MTAPCFVDANIFVYAHEPSEPLKHEVARDLLHRLWADSSGRTSTQALNEFYTVLTCKLSGRIAQHEAWAEVEEYLRWNPQPVDTQVLHRARQIESRYRLNWWDCLIVAAAQIQGCARLYTEDLQHGADFDGLRVSNPFVTQVQEIAPVYRVQVTSPHRPRGRPRRVA